MTSPSPSADLSRLRINRDAPPPELRRALGRNAVIAALALLLIVGAIFALRRGGPVPVQVVTVAATGGSEGGAGAGPSASVTANGYVVARTRASVSAKLPGRIADLRVSEGSTIRTLGFQPRSVLASFLAESALIALVGGVIGALIALPVNGMVTSTTNWASFSEIAFAFRITPGLLLSGILFALVMGLVGGFFPARRAAKQPVVQALR